MNCRAGFFSGDDGKLYRSKTAIGNFLNFSGYETVMTDEVGKLLEASNVYRVQGTDKYLRLVEAYGPRYFRAWTSTSLNARGHCWRTSSQRPSRGGQLGVRRRVWTNDISHGEMIRTGCEETLSTDACNMQYLYQGVDPASTAV